MCCSLCLIVKTARVIQQFLEQLTQFELVLSRGGLNPESGNISNLSKPGVKVVVFLEQLKRWKVICGEEQWGQLGDNFGLFYFGKFLRRVVNRVRVPLVSRGENFQKARY